MQERRDEESAEVYKGFDLSDFEEDELPEMLALIDSIHENMTSLKAVFSKVTELGDCAPEKLGKTIRKVAHRYYGGTDGPEIAEAIIAAMAGKPYHVRLAMTRAFEISYSRQFEDTESEPIHPLDFEYTDLFNTLSGVLGGPNMFTAFMYH